MSDDLVKRLRDQQTKWMTPLLSQAADRISALEAALAKADEFAEASDVSSNYIDGGSCIGACDAYADLVDASIAYRQARDATR